MAALVAKAGISGASLDSLASASAFMAARMDLDEQAARFLSGLTEPKRDRVSSAGLRAALLRHLQAVKAAFPTWPLDEARLTQALLQRARAADDILLALEGLHAEDLFLVQCCLDNQQSALTELDGRLMQAVGLTVSQLRLDGATGEEVAQLVRQKLLVPNGDSPPKLNEYAGRGPLLMWLRVTATRVALNLMDSAERRAPHGDYPNLVAENASPESVLEKRRLSPELKQALESALSQLTARERNYLRLYFVEGLTVEAIAQMEGTHKSTISRWMTKSRSTLLGNVRAELQKRWRLDETELDTALAQLQSDLDLSLLRILS